MKSAQHVAANDGRIVDWLVLSALRSSTNRYLHFVEPTPATATREGAFGVTMPNDVQRWLQYTNRYGLVRNETQLLTGLPGLKHALTLKPGTHDVIMLVKLRMLQHDTSPFANVPNHYVVLKEPVIVHGEYAPLTYWSWGNEYGPQTIEKDMFESSYHGAIIAGAERSPFNTKLDSPSPF